MPSSIKLLASETLMCGLKSIPIAGKAFEVVDAVRTRREMLAHTEQLAEIEGQMTRMERRLRDLVEEEIRATLDQLRQPGLDGGSLDREIRNFRQIQEQGWEPALFEGLLANSNHLAELRRNPQHYGQVLDGHEQVDPTKIHILIDADPLRILELFPFAFAALLANQPKGVPPALIESAADIWAFLGEDEEPSVSVNAEGPNEGRLLGARVRVPQPGTRTITTWDGVKAGDRKVMAWGGLELPFRWCPPGAFRMGSPDDEPGRYANETQVDVLLTRGFWMLETPVTQGLWKAMMGSNPSRFQDSANLPVELVSWDEATAFGETLTERLRSVHQLPTDWAIRLPTEAQWEYACRAGTTSATAFGDSLSSLDANFDGNDPYNGTSRGPYRERTSEVGSYRPNAWGLYDLHGNVWEWCRDGHEETLPGGFDPFVDLASHRMLRGGCWVLDGKSCRSACRNWSAPEGRSPFNGFRVAAVHAELSSSVSGLR